MNINDALNLLRVHKYLDVTINNDTVLKDCGIGDVDDIPSGGDGGGSTPSGDSKTVSVCGVPSALIVSPFVPSTILQIPQEIATDLADSGAQLVKFSDLPTIINDFISWMGNNTEIVVNSNFSQCWDEWNYLPAADEDGWNYDWECKYVFPQIQSDFSYVGQGTDTDNVGEFTFRISNLNYLPSGEILMSLDNALTYSKNIYDVFKPAAEAYFDIIASEKGEQATIEYFNAQTLAEAKERSIATDLSKFLHAGGSISAHYDNLQDLPDNEVYINWFAFNGKLYIHSSWSGNHMSWKYSINTNPEPVDPSNPEPGEQDMLDWVVTEASNYLPSPLHDYYGMEPASM